MQFECENAKENHTIRTNSTMAGPKATFIAVYKLLPLESNFSDERFSTFTQRMLEYIKKDLLVSERSGLRSLRKIYWRTLNLKI